jgi:DNA polymerase III alpha subunit
MGIKVLPPDVNDSDSDFTPRGTDIRFGLSAIRNVGTNVVASVVRTRETKGRFADFSDFLRKVDAVACNKKTVESLCKAGAFDSLGHSRKGLVAVHAEAIDACMDTKRNEAIGQFDLFGGGDEDGAGDGGLFDVAVPMGEWEKPVLLTYEREMLGLYVSDHPLFGVEHVLAGAVDLPVSGLAECDDGRTVVVGGILSSVTRKMTKQGNPWALVTLEDLEGAVEVMFFPQSYVNAPSTSSRTPSCSSAAGSTSARTSRRSSPTRSPSPTCRSDRADRSSSRSRRRAARHRSSSASRRSCPPTPARPTSTCSSSTAGARRSCGSTTACGCGPRRRCSPT